MSNPKPPTPNTCAQAAEALMRLPERDRAREQYRDRQPRPERPSTKLAKSRFLAAFKLSGIIQHGCSEAGVSRATVRKWLEKDEKFRQKFLDAQEGAADVVEAELWKRAVVGEEEDVFNRHGEVIGTRRKKSDILLMFLMKGMRPQKYKERMESSETNERVKQIEEELQRLGVVQKIEAGGEFNVEDVLEEDPKTQPEPEPVGTPEEERREANSKVIDVIVEKAETKWRRGGEVE